MSDELTPQELAELITTFGSHNHGDKRLISPIEVAKRIQRLLDVGKSKREIASLLATNNRDVQSQDTSMINIFLKVLSLPEEFHNQIAFGKEKNKIGVWIAYEISKISDPIIQKELLGYVYANKFSKWEVRNIVQYYKKKKVSYKSISEIVGQVLTQRETEQIREVLIGHIFPEPFQQISKLSNTQFIKCKKLLKSSLIKAVTHGELFEINIRGRYFYLIMNNEFKKKIYNQYGPAEDNIVKAMNSFILRAVGDNYVIS